VSPERASGISAASQFGNPANKVATPVFSSHRFVSLKAAEKIISLANLPGWRRVLRRAGKKLVVTNGCFDLLHAGHVTYLEMAREKGDLLLVGLNGDQSVRNLKGPGRPINSEQDRAVVLAALAAVDAVCVFSETRAASFMALAARRRRNRLHSISPRPIDKSPPRKDRFSLIRGWRLTLFEIFLLVGVAFPSMTTRKKMVNVVRV
jgi:cytidyltransferase-like protein